MKSRGTLLPSESAASRCAVAASLPSGASTARLKELRADHLRKSSALNADLDHLVHLHIDDLNALDAKTTSNEARAKTLAANAAAHSAAVSSIATVVGSPPGSEAGTLLD